MPTYEYRCSECGTIKEIVHSIKESPKFFCESCDPENKKDPLERLISQNIAGGFCFKGMGTESMIWKEKRIRNKKNADLEMRQLERWGGSTPKLTPNVGGEVYDSWDDAGKAAKSKGLDDSKYKQQAEASKSISKVSGIDDSKWKAVKEKKNSV